MNATKRKFNALLNGIGTKSTTSLSSTVNNASQGDLTSTSDADFQAKKRRLSSLNSIPSQASSVPKASLDTSTPAMRHKKSSSLAAGVPTTETPKYAPWDRAAFLKRLKSFSNLTDWTPKPTRVNEVEWAKRGWVCQKFERVRCCLCNVEILVKLNRREVDGKEEPVYVAQNIEDALVDKYVELIVTSHGEDCLWRKRGCDDSIFKLPLNHAPTTLHTLRERYNELCTRSQTLPYVFNIRTPPALDIDLVLSYLPHSFFASPSEPTTYEINKVALLMALFGWQGHTHDRLGIQLGSVSCQACFRVLGLWLFKSKEVNEVGEEVVGPAMNGLDIVTEHRDYCPWRNPASQNGLKSTSKPGESAMAGWEIVIRVLKNDHHLRHSGVRQREKDTIVADTGSEGSTFGAEMEDEDAKSIREEKDKERWARLRRVKSLFDTKAGKKLQRSGGAIDPKRKSRM